MRAKQEKEEIKNFQELFKDSKRIKNQAQHQEKRLKN